jgi:hypothetical protein
MSKLALYDKREGDADRAVNGHFRHDYIYRKNLGTRLSVGIGAAFIVIVRWLQVIVTQGLDALMQNLQQNITDAVMFILAVMAVYTVIGTIQSTRQYYLAQKRLQRYYGLLRILDRIEERAARRQQDYARDESEEGLENRYGANSRRKRSRR